jgi:hypothetical protein
VPKVCPPREPARVAQLGEHLLCKQAEIQCKLLLWLRFRIFDPAKCVPKMFLPWRFEPARFRYSTLFASLGNRSVSGNRGSLKASSRCPTLAMAPTIRS